MKKAIKYFIFLTLCLLQGVNSIAQQLPEAPRDPSVHNGRLPNGVSYFLVENPTTAGTADFALVQRTGRRILGESAGNIARENLASLPRFAKAPQAFLTSCGVAPSKDGFVKVSESSTLYHFDNVRLTDESVDSVLLVLMGIVDRGTLETGPEWEWYAPEDHAVIVAGDINASQFASKIKMLSYMTPARPSKERVEEAWKDNEEPVFEIVEGASKKVATINVTWSSPRISKEFAGTVLPVVYSMYLNELGILAKERLRQRLFAEGIPVAEISHKYSSSVKYEGSEDFMLSVTVARQHIIKAMEVLASVASSLDKGAASSIEFERAKRSYMVDLEADAAELFRSNANYVESCASAFLYGAPLSSPKELYPYLKYRVLSVEADLAHFNKIASAVLDGQKNLKVTCSGVDGESLFEGDLQQAFSAAWTTEGADFEYTQQVDTLNLPRAGLPIKLTRTKKDPMSSGVVWTFENGFQVVYKRQETGRKMHFALALNGGYGNIKGLSKGEGAYVSDYLGLSSVSGATNEEFRLNLDERDIRFNTTVNISNTIIDGSAPESELDIMMRYLLAFINSRSNDKRAFEYYKSCQDLKGELQEGTVRDRIIAIDSLMCPGYVYSSLKTAGRITEDFPEKVEAFWEHQCQKLNDGVLVLVGNIEETRLRKFLQTYVGQFKTTDRAYPRLNVSYQPVSGSIAYTFEGEKNSIDFAISSRMPLTAENYMASNIAVLFLKQLISNAIDGTGMYLELKHDCRIYPQERFNLIITLEEAQAQGFAISEGMMGAEKALAVLRKTIADLSKLEISEADLLIYKEILKEHMALKLSDPRYWVQALAMRYLDGKDFTTSYASRIDAVTAAKVKNILASLSTTSKVEYIITEK